MSFLKTGVIPQCKMEKKKQFLLAAKSFEIQIVGSEEKLSFKNCQEFFLSNQVTNT
jgi:hypothetical protein